MADKVPAAAGNGAMLVKPSTWEALRQRVEDLEIIPDPKDFDVSQRGGKQFIRLRGVPGSTRPGPPPIPPFTLSAGKDGARIYKGWLEWTVTTLTFERRSIAVNPGSLHSERVNLFLGQDAISGIEKINWEENENYAEDPGEDADWLELNWWGDVWAKWTVDIETGHPTEFSIVGPEKPELSPIPALTEDLTRDEDSGSGAGVEMGYCLRIGTVPEDGRTTQDRTGNLHWAHTFIPAVEESSEESSGGPSGEDSSGGGASGASDGSSGSGTGSGGESEKSSNAIVIMPWNPDGFGAMATVESGEVLFEFCCRRVPLTGNLTRAKLDPRFVFLCEPGSLEIMSAPVGPKPCAVGAEIVGDEILLRSACLGSRANNWVNFKVTGVRRGFAGWDMENRTATQKAQADATNRAAYDR